MSIQQLQDEVVRLQDLLTQRQALVNEVQTQLLIVQKQLAAAQVRALVDTLLPLLSEAQLGALDTHLRTEYAALL